MKILFFNEIAAPLEGGRNQYVLDVAARLREAGETVALVHGRHPASTFQGTGYVFDHLGRAGAATGEVRMRLEAIIEDFAPDVIQLHGVDNFALHEWMAAHAPTVRFLHNHQFYCSGGDMTRRFPRVICERVHGPGCLRCHYLNRCGSLNPLANVAGYRRVSRALKALRHLHGIQVASPVIRENLVRNGIEPERIEHIPLYAPVPAAAKRPIRTARRMVLHPGGLVQNKGVWLMVNGLSRLPPDVELVFAGGGNLKERLEGVIRRRHLSERVRVMGDLSPKDWSELYHQAELVVFPSRWNEPVGLPGLLAMAHAKPVVAFESGGVSGWLEHGVNGSAVRFNDAREFIREVAALLERPKKLVEMGKRGNEIWDRKFRPRHHVERLRDYYAHIAASPGGRTPA